MTKYHPFKELQLFRIRNFVREPAVIFWVYGFPVLLAVALGVAFANRPPESIAVDVADHPDAPRVVSALEAARGFVVRTCSATECSERLRLGKSSLTVVPGTPATFRYDPTRPESILARQRVDDALERAAGRRDVLQKHDEIVREAGARYIDFLVPGLLGMNLMGGGLWGVGFVVVDMRVRKLLKRLVASPMNRSHFLLSLIGGRFFFILPEIAIILGAGALFFGVSIRGNWAAIALVCIVGALAFSGLGLLAACRARRLETASGLINLIMLPMWLLSGIFFSAERFPAALQPFVQALPLTQLNAALRSVILDGASVASQAARLGQLGLWAAVSFGCALRWFRWN